MTTDGASKRQFWRRGGSRLPGSIQQVYGAQHPPFNPQLLNSAGKGAVGVPAVGLAGGPVSGAVGGSAPLFSAVSMSVGVTVGGIGGGGSSRKAASFQEFAADTSDAWDAEPSDDELLNMATRGLASDVVMSTAREVIQKHERRRRSAGPTPRGGGGGGGGGAEEEEGGGGGEAGEGGGEGATGPEGRMVKSQSEFVISGRVAGGLERGSLPRQQSVTLPPPSRPVIPLVARIADQNTTGSMSLHDRDAAKLDKFHQLLAASNTDLEELRKLSWSGIPKPVRPVTWRLLSGYLPATSERREPTLQRKRLEYFSFIEQYYDSRNEEHHQDTFRQIHIDIPRTNPLIPLFQQPAVQEIFERILFIWAIRHPASGYVQGINDLVTPFFVVFLAEHVEEEVENFDVASLPEETLRNIEADSFWCMSKLLDGIQDNYTFAQPGIQQKVNALRELVRRIDETIHRHVAQHEVEYLQFAFRWMNNLLMRELPLRCTIRLWDTYQSEPEGFSQFHLYVCAAFLIHWRKEILAERDFQGLMILLQNLPTMHWGNEEVSVLLAEAYRLKYMFADAPNHYRR
uniref:TBC1 domain family member 22B isoform X1 n=1 Tax=Petromyzon marinus TaxID=7757 RepID=A0AAJ7TZL5_PETMA|nr:TBC1 domain family member 22B isoform X1 [Petromyzon marinus]